MPRAEKPPIDERIRMRWFDDREVVAALDEMGVDGVVAALRTIADDGHPDRSTTYSAGSGLWKVGDPRPALADDDPAVMQAIGRCAAHQVRLRMPAILPSLVAAHPAPCAWCEYPARELLAACDWATVMARHVGSEVLTWRGANGTAYRRTGREGAYLAAASEAFWALPPAAREVAVHRAQYPDAVPA